MLERGAAVLARLDRSDVALLGDGPVASEPLRRAGTGGDRRADALALARQRDLDRRRRALAEGQGDAGPVFAVLAVDDDLRRVG